MALNSVYITVGIAVIAVLVTALVGPLFVDWTAYRVSFERQAEKLIGREVKILGEADAFLLPTPSITFTDMRIGDSENPLMIVSKFSARVELAPLLKGEVRVIDMTLERPDVRLVLDEEGRLTTFGEAGRSKNSTAFDPAAVAFEQVDIRDGSIQLSDARSAQIHELRKVDLRITARALIGPFKADGSLEVANQPYKIKIATGKYRGDGGFRVKLQLNPQAYPAEMLLDGRLSAENLLPQYAGTFTLERKDTSTAEDIENAAAAETDLTAIASTPDPWRIEGAFKVADAALSVDNYELTWGPEDRRFNLNGSGRIDLGAVPKFDVNVRAKQIDLDRMLAAKSNTSPIDAAGTIEALFAGLKRVPKPILDGQVHFDLPGIVVAGGAIQDLSFRASTTSRGWYLADLSGRLPGRSKIELNGDVGLTKSVAFEGDMVLSVEQPAALAGWWRGGGLTVGATLDPLQVSGRLTIGKTGVSLTEAKLKTDLSLGSGNLAWQPAQPGRPASFALDLDADRFELTQLGAAARLALAGYQQKGGGVTDVGVHVRVGTLLTDDVEASGVELAVNFSGETLKINRMILADLAGARIIADGEIQHALTTPDGDLKFDLTADKLDGIAALIADLFPNSDLARRLTNASGLLGPAIVSASFKGREADDASEATLDISGDIGGSELKVLGTFSGRVDTWRDANIGLDASLEGPNGSHVLGQLGFDVLPIRNSPFGRISLSSKGEPSTGLGVDIDVDVAGTTLTLIGAATFPNGGDMTLGFEAAAESADLTQIALLTGRVLPILAGKVPGKLKGQIEGGGTTFAFSDMTGKIAGVAVSGQGNIDLKSDVPRINGKLRIDEIDLKFLTELAFGADSWASSGAGEATRIWPSAPFGAPLLGYVSADVDVRTDRLWLTDAEKFDNAQFRIDLTPNGLALDNVSGRFLDGEAVASLQIKRSDEGEAVMSAVLRIINGDMADVVWRDEAGPRATGRFDFTIDTNSTGRSIAALLSALAGGGTLTVRDGTVNGIDPAAFPAIVKAIDNGLQLENEPVRAAFIDAFSGGSFDFRTMDTVLTVASGTIRARNMALDAATTRAIGSATLDLNDFSFESDWTIGVDAEVTAVAGAEPQVVLRYEGHVVEPALAIDIDPFMSYLTLRAYEQEVGRVEALQAEILERDRLTRDLRRLREDRAKRETEERRLLLEAETARAEAAELARQRQKLEIQQENRRRDEPAPIEDPQAREPSSGANERRAIANPPSRDRLAPLPAPIEIGPGPGAPPALFGSNIPGQPPAEILEQPVSSRTTRKPLGLLPQASRPVAAQPRRQPKKRRQKYITTTGDRIITMPEYDPNNRRAIETTGDRIIMMPN